jgi:hypothetical protein
MDGRKSKNEIALATLLIVSSRRRNRDPKLAKKLKP